MKHNSGNRRSRPRSGKQRHGGGGGRSNYESNGPDGKVRGSAHQVLDKYLALARDAQLSGDRINAESFYQYAEHYYRVLNADGGNGQVRRERSTPSDDLNDDLNDDEGDEVGGDHGPGNSYEAKDTPPALDPSEQPQPDIADMIPPAIAIPGGDEGGPAPKPRRRRRPKSDAGPADGASDTADEAEAAPAP